MKTKKYVWCCILSIYLFSFTVKNQDVFAAEDGGALKTEGVVGFTDKKELSTSSTVSNKEKQLLPNAGETQNGTLSTIGFILLLIWGCSIGNRLSKRKRTFLLLMLIIIPALPKEALAIETEPAVIDFERNSGNHIVDPEFPNEIVDPGEYVQAGQYLRLEFVPQLNFGSHTPSNIDKLYFANAQLFRDKTNARGNFIQVSDIRERNLGWKLFVKQETQFTSLDQQKSELNGAMISFDQVWINSRHEKPWPQLYSKSMQLIPGEVQQLAEAKSNEGVGTWLISFGASNENVNSQKNTLIPKVDANDQSLLDPVYHKPIYQNKAVTLHVPGKSEKNASLYQTEITWILSELP